MSTIDAKGKCLCGAVNIQAKTLSTQVGACHCNTCRKWTGGPLLTVECKGEALFSGQEQISVYDSSDWAERGFCANCGTHLFYRLKPNNQYIFPAGLFEIDDRLNFEHQIFIEQKPDYYCFSNQTKNMTGEEVFALFAGN
ncbi:GFA family protein [Neptunicella sp. SCSIO 80796]|uniref:GFA family protein n=1 Tax=Neptunicella plasticusilytica TaxID=3117012 RepID=UPI003A4E3689